MNTQKLAWQVHTAQHTHTLAHTDCTESRSNEKDIPRKSNRTRKRSINFRINSHSQRQCMLCSIIAGLQNIMSEFHAIKNITLSLALAAQLKHIHRELQEGMDKKHRDEQHAAIAPAKL